MTARTARALLVLVLMALVAAPVAAGDDARDRAELEMKVGYDAARAGYWQEALMRFRNADSLQPGQARILNNIAIALEATARYDEALVVYEQAVAAAPGDPVLQRNFRLFKEFYRQHVAEPATEEDGGESDDDQQE